MLRIQQITSDAKQKRTLNLEDGSTVTFTMYYIPLQFGWFITELVHNDVTIRGVRITNDLNILHQFRNIIPFGLACISDEKREPTQIEDFEEEASKLYILTSEEVLEYSEFLSVS